MRRLAAKLYYFLYFRAMGGHFVFMLKVRKYLLQRLLRQELESLVVRPQVYITGYKGLAIGAHVSINHNCFLSCEGGLTIGDYVSIGHNTSIMTTEHCYGGRNVPIKYQGIRSAPVTLGSNIWVGAKVTILAGVSIADGTVIAAGAVVAKDVTEPDTIVGGVPARYIKSRFQD